MVGVDLLAGFNHMVATELEGCTGSYATLRRYLSQAIPTLSKLVSDEPERPPASIAPVPLQDEGRALELHGHQLGKSPPFLNADFPLQRYKLPAEKHCPLSFLQDVVAGKKNLMHQDKLIKIDNPGWPEFSNVRIWNEAIKNPNFMQYIPSSWTFSKGGRDPEKDYVWAITCVLQPEWVMDNIDRIRGERIQYKLDNMAVKPPDTVINPAWVTQLLSQPFIPSKCHLLSHFFVDLLTTFMIP